MFQNDATWTAVLTAPANPVTVLATRVGMEAFATSRPATTGALLTDLAPMAPASAPTVTTFNSSKGLDNRWDSPKTYCK